MQSAAYFKRRFEDAETRRFAAANRINANIKADFAAATAELDAKILRWQERFAANNGISLADARQWLGKLALVELRWSVEEYVKQGAAQNPAFTRKLENASVQWHISRLESLKIDTQMTIDRLFGAVEGKVKSFLGDTVTESHARAAYSIQKGLNVGFEVGKIDQAQLDALLARPWAADGRTFSARLWRDQDALLRELDKTLTQSLITGEAYGITTKKLAAAMGVSEAQAARIVATESAYFAAVGNLQSYRELGVEEYAILATFCATTCADCGALDGKVYKISEYVPGVTAEPFHPNCRCTTVPHYGDEEVGERFARDAQGRGVAVPSDMTFEQWRDKFVVAKPAQGLTNSGGSGIMEVVKRAATTMIAPKTISQTATFDELETMLQDEYKITMSDEVKTLGFENVKGALSGAESMMDEFSALKTAIKGVEVRGVGTMGYGGGKLYFDPKDFANGIDFNELCKAQSENGNWVKNASAESVGAHEMGHAVTQILIDKNPNYRNTAQKKEDWENHKTAENIVSEATNATKKPSTSTHGISRYATENASETIAEAFADVFANGENAHPLSIEIMRIIKERMKQYV